MKRMMGHTTLKPYSLVGEPHDSTPRR
jgi:hypothetical protein